MSVDDFEYSLAVPRLPYEHVIFTHLESLEGVLVDLKTKKYYQLNETASLIWRGLERQLPVSHIAKEMTDCFEVTMEGAISSIETALRHFEAQQLVRPANSGSKR